MKRIIILAVLAVLIPFFIISFYKKDKEIKFNFEQNILVKVKTLFEDIFADLLQNIISQAFFF